MTLVKLYEKNAVFRPRSRHVGKCGGPRRAELGHCRLARRSDQYPVMVSGPEGDSQIEIARAASYLGWPCLVFGAESISLGTRPASPNNCRARPGRVADLLSEPQAC